MIALNSALSLSKTLLAGLAIGAVIKIIDVIVNSAERAIEKSQEALSSIEELNREIGHGEKVIEQYGQRYAELAQHVNQIDGSNIDLSTEEYEEFLSINEALTDTFNTLPRIYNDNGNAIAMLNGDVKTITKSMEDLLKKEQQMKHFQIAEQLPTVFEGVQAQSKKYERTIEEARIEKSAMEASVKELQNGTNLQAIMDNILGQRIHITGYDTNDLHRVKEDYMNILEEAKIDFAELTPDYEVNEFGMEVPVGFTLQITSPQEDIEKAKKIIETSVSELVGVYHEGIVTLQDQIDYTTQNNKTNWSSLTQNLTSWLEGNNTYKIMSDSMRNLVQQAINTTNWDELTFKDWDDLEYHITDNILALFEDVETKNAIESLFSLSEELPVGEYLTLVEQAIAVVQAYCDKHGIEIPLFITNVGTDVTKMQEDVKGFLQDKYDGQVDGLEVTDLRIASQLEIPEGVLLTWEELEQKIKDIKKIDRLDETLSLSSANHEALDEYYSKLDKIQSVYSELDSKVDIPASTITELMQMFPDYDWNDIINGTKELQTALNDLSVESLAKIRDTLNDVPNSEGLIQQLKELNNSSQLDGLQSAISNTIGELDALDSAIHSVQTNQSLSASEVRNLLELYPQLAEYISDTSDGYKIEANELINLREEIYNTSSANINTQIEQTEATIKNVQLRIEAYKEEMKALNRVVLAASIVDTDGQDLAQTEKEQERLDALARAMDFDTGSLDDLLTRLEGLKGIRKQLDTPDKPDDDDDDDDKEELTEIDWADNSLTNLQNEVTQFETALENTKGIDNQIKAIDNLNDALEDLQSGYQGAYNEYEDRYTASTKDLSDDIVKKIESGEEFDLSEYDSDMAEKIQEAIDNRSKMFEAEAQINEIGIRISDNEKLEKSMILQGSYEAQLDTIDTKLENQNLTLTEKQKLLEQQYALRLLINEELRRQAEYEGNPEEVVRLKEENKNLKQQRKEEEYELEAETRGYYLSDVDNDIQDIQNDITSQGGRGTKEQYTQLEELYGESKSYWLQQKADAESMLVTTDKGTAAWDRWNSEVQEAENNIAKCDENVKEVHSSILKLPLNDVEDKLREIENKLKDINEDLENQDSYISAATGLLDQEVKTQELLKEVIQDKIDNLEKEKELREQNLAVQQAEWNLEKARGQKTNQVFYEGVGWTYESDPDEVRDAELAYDEALYNKQLYLLNEQIAVHDTEIERLNKIKGSWTEITEQAQHMVNLRNALLYDSDFVEKVLSGDLFLVNSISAQYSTLTTQKNDLEDQQKNYTTLQDEINETVDLYNLDAITYDQAKQRVSEAIKKYYPEIVASYNDEASSLDKVAKKKLEDAGVTETTSEGMVEDIKTSNELIKESYDKLIENLTVIFGQLNSLLSGFSSNVSSMASSISATLQMIRDQLAATQTMKTTVEVEAKKVTTENSKEKSDSKDVETKISSKKETTQKATTKVNTQTTVQNKKPNVRNMLEYHQGLELGYVGENASINQDKDDFRYIALNELSGNEVVTKLLKSEAVLTEPQISTVMDNFRKVAQVSLPPLLSHNTQPSQSVSFTGDIIVKSDNVDTLAREIKMNLPSKMLQQLYTNK